MLEEVNIEDFAVKLTLSGPKPAMETFRGETEGYLKDLEGMRGFDIKPSELIGKKNRVIFVGGIAGTGKSVFAKQLTYMWANDELFKDFKVCISFECRELNYFVVNEGAALKQHELIAEFIKTRFAFNTGSTEQVLFIVDGLDELYDINETNSIMCQLLDLKKSKYPESKIIITGRPHIENKLLSIGKSMGCLRKVEICGLSDKQIEEYIRKFAPTHIDIAKIFRAKSSSGNNLNFLHLPQMLNSFCCVVLLSKDIGIKNAAELYTWTFYLLLKQHAEKDGSQEKRVSEIFNEYSKDLLMLSKICHDLLSKNTIIFEGNIELQFGNIGNGKEFLMGLFVDVSDNFNERKQFKHLTLMEFLSAVYVCSTKNPAENIKDILKKRLYQVLLFNCQLISGLMYDGIIKDMFTTAVKLEDVDCYNFFCDILKLVRECVKGCKDDYVDESFELSIDIIMCLLNKDVISKQFILPIINQLCFENVRFSERKLLKMMKLLVHSFECTYVELRKAFENVRLWRFEVNDCTELKYAQYFASVDELGLSSRSPFTVTTTVGNICKKIDEVIDCVKCKRVTIASCDLQDEDYEDEIGHCSKLEGLRISSCSLTEKSFIKLCKWVMASSLEEFELAKITGMKTEWWKVLFDSIVNLRERSDRDLALRSLKIFGCTFMHGEMKRKVIVFILIHSYSSFITISIW